MVGHRKDEASPHRSAPPTLQRIALAWPPDFLKKSTHQPEYLAHPKLSTFLNTLPPKQAPSFHPLKQRVNCITPYFQRLLFAGNFQESLLTSPPHCRTIFAMKTFFQASPEGRVSKLVAMHRHCV
jgi:hypothetical protein